jgi:RecA/RadA recombinase
MEKKVLHKKSDEVANHVNNHTRNDVEFVTRKINVDRVLSTGSTLLDLAISGKRRRGGGIPGGIIAEFYGPSGSGKSAVLQEIVASCQNNGGDAKIQDPEGRLDAEYARIYGTNITDKNYTRPDTVEEIFEDIKKWKPQPSQDDSICVIGTDSLAALSTELEMTKGDKMGMKRAKDFSAGFRKTARIIANNNWLMACTNQIRQGDYGETTPGGLAVAFYASLRVRVKEVEKIEDEVELMSKDEKEKRSVRAKMASEKEKKSNVYKKTLGIKTLCWIRKSTVDDPYREVPIYIIFGYGIDDIRGNLQYIKDMSNSTVYTCPDGKTYQSMKKAIAYFYTTNEDGEVVEKEDLVKQLKEQTIDLWEEIEAKFDSHRAPKTRG